MGEQNWHHINTANEHIKNKNKFFEVYNFHSLMWYTKEKHIREDLKNYENILLPLLTVKIGLKE